MYCQSPTATVTHVHFHCSLVHSYSNSDKLSQSLGSCLSLPDKPIASGWCWPISTHIGCMKSGEQGTVRLQSQGVPEFTLFLFWEIHCLSTSHAWHNFPFIHVMLVGALSCTKSCCKHSGGPSHSDGMWLNFNDAWEKLGKTPKCWMMGWCYDQVMTDKHASLDPQFTTMHCAIYILLCIQSDM